MYRTIAHPSQRINATLAALGLKPAGADTVAQAIKHNNRLYHGAMKNRDSKKFFFKARLQNDPWLLRSLRHEACVLQELGRREKKLSFLFPHLVANGRVGAFSWLVREYWAGTFSGDMNETYGMTAAFLRRVSPGSLARAVTDIGRLPVSFPGDTGTVRHGRLWYVRDLEHYERNIFPPFYKHRLNVNGFQPGMFREFRRLINSSPAFKRLVFNHGDMYPNNIFLDTRGRLTINDWDFSNLNLATFDASMVALHAWRSPHWAASFARAFSAGRRSLRPSWLITHISLTVRLTGYAIVRLLKLEADRYPSPTPPEQRELQKLLRHHGTVLHKLSQAPSQIIKQLCP